MSYTNQKVEIKIFSAEVPGHDVLRRMLNHAVNGDVLCVGMTLLGLPSRVPTGYLPNGKPCHAAKVVRVQARKRNYRKKRGEN